MELIVDNFAGGGGASTGIEMALGRPVDHAINHDKFALGMHRINHPRTVHHCEDVFDVDPIRLAGGERVGFGWFSPDCKHFSKAKGGLPVDKNIRGLVLVMLRWAKIRTRVMSMENVEEIETWGPLLPNGKPDPKHKGRTWRAFLAALSNGVNPDHPDLPEMLEVLGDSVTREELVAGFGYYFEYRIIRAYTIGVRTIRKRLYMIARCDGRTIAWPQQTHEAPAKAVKYLKPWRTIAECIDWDTPCPSIFLSKAEARRLRCKRPLVKATCRRIATGVDRYVMKAKEPFLVNLTHGGRVQSISEPIRTLTGANRGEKALVSAHLAREFGQSVGQSVEAPAPTIMPDGQGKTRLVSTHLMKFHGDNSGQSVNEPAPTITANSYRKRPGGAPPLGLCAANLVKLRGNVETHNRPASAAEPAHTISAAGTHHALSCAYLAQHNAGNNTNPGHPATEPISTISTKGCQQTVVAANLAAYYGTERDGQAIDEPLRAATAKARFGIALSEAVAPIITVEHLAGARRVAKFLREHGVQFEGEFATVGGFVIVDIGMRMLQPRELFRAQGFPDEYVIDRAWVIDPQTGEIVEIALTKEQQIRMCGNSVCPDMAEAITRLNVPELAAGRGRAYRPQELVTA